MGPRPTGFPAPRLGSSPTGGEADLGFAHGVPLAALIVQVRKLWKRNCLIKEAGQTMAPSLRLQTPTVGRFPAQSTLFHILYNSTKLFILEERFHVFWVKNRMYKVPLKNTRVINKTHAHS